MSANNKRPSSKEKSSESLRLDDMMCIELAIEFANFASSESVDSATYAQNTKRLLFRRFGIDYIQPNSTPRERKWILREQNVIAKHLEAIVENPTLSPDFEREINRVWLRWIRTYPQMRGGRLTFEYSFSEIEEAPRLGIALLFHTGLAKRLRQCARKKCQIFFLASGNRSRMKYCSPKCSGDAEREHSKKRQAELRKRWRK